MPVPPDPLDPEAAKAAKIKVANVHAGDRRKQGFAKGTLLGIEATRMRISQGRIGYHFWYN